MNKRCTVCHQDNIFLISSNLSVYGCNSCSHQFSLIPKEKQEKYDGNYFLNTHKNWMSNPNLKLFDFIYRKIGKLLKKENIKLLDVGCGNGDFLKYLAAKDSSFDLFGVDLAENKYSEITFINKDFVNDQLDELKGLRFDVVCGLAVVEHVENPHLFIQKVSNFLQPNGVVFLMTINSNSLIYKIAKTLNRMGVKGPFNRLYSVHHLQHYTSESLIKLMLMNDFDILLKISHNYSLKAVDVPGRGFIRVFYKIFVAIIFPISSLFKNQICQTIVCRKNK